MNTLMEVRHLSVGINRPLEVVADFVSQPANFALWAEGLGSSLCCEGSHWTAETPSGKITVEFSEKNSYGVADHYVSLPTGARVFVPMRVVPNGPGAEVVLTIFRQPSVTAEEYSADIEAVLRDLRKLKDFLERG
jgi:hypothetical protein